MCALLAMREAGTASGWVDGRDCQQTTPQLTGFSLRVPGDYTKQHLAVHWLPIVFHLFTKAHFLLIVSCCLAHFTPWRGAYIALSTASKQQKATWTSSGNQARGGSENTMCLKCTGNRCTGIPQRYEAAQLRWPAMADFNSEKDPELWPDQPTHPAQLGPRSLAWPGPQPSLVRGVGGPVATQPVPSALSCRMDSVPLQWVTASRPLGWAPPAPPVPGTTNWAQRKLLTKPGFINPP